MKTGWEVAELSTVCDVFTDGNWIESKDQSLDGIRLIQTGNVGEGIFKDRRDKARFIDDATFDRLKCFEVLPGDCLISRLPDPVGRACEIPETGDKMITAVDCSVVRVNGNRLNRNYFIYYSQSRTYLRDVDDVCSGTTRRRISRKNLGKIKIPLPPLDEQKRIVAVLDAAFDGLARARARAEANLQNARELFESVLDEEFGHENDAWHLKTIYDLCTIGDGNHSSKYPKKSEMVAKGVPFLRATNIRNGEVDKTKMLYISEKKHRDLKKGHLRGGDILFTNRGEIGKVAIVPNDLDGANLNSQVAWLRCSNLISNKFLFYQLQSRRMKAHFLSTKSGAALQQFTIKMLKNLRISIPDRSEQELIVIRIATAEEKVSVLLIQYQQKLIDIDDLRQSLLQKAFAGELT